MIKILLLIVISEQRGGQAPLPCGALFPFTFLAPVSFAFLIEGGEGHLIGTATGIVAVTILLCVAHLDIEAKDGIEFLLQRFDFLVAADGDVAT